MVLKILCDALIIVLISAKPQISKPQETCTDTNGKQCNFCLSQTDFSQGTYRITKSGSYCFTESVTFNPSPGKMNIPNTKGAWHPTDPDLFPGCLKASEGPFALGFFAAISIETNNIIIDLNNHILKMHYAFYLQQRFYAHIEIAPQPFLPRFGPTDFGEDFINVENIIIKNGELGLTSHHGIHSNNATNILIQNLKIYGFEVAGVQLNGFHGVTVLKDLQIGPSASHVALSGYYSNGRFLLLALHKLLSTIKKEGLEVPMVSFSYLSKGESLSLQTIYNRLVLAMDMVFLDKLNILSEEEMETDLYKEAISLFSNREELPDGSAVYGILLNSFSVAVNGFGEAESNGINDKVLLKDIDIKELKISVNEIPAIYFDECSYLWSESQTVMKGPFGDIMDIRKMIDTQYVDIIENLDVIKGDVSQLKYVGNVLSDAQIALYLYGKHYNYVGDNVNYAFRSYLHPAFIDWVLDGVPLPSCVRFVCNGDIMFHTNKGIMGFRMDGIKDVKMENMKIRGLVNSSPLSSNTCSDYSGPFDGGIPGSREGEGGMNTDVRGYSFTDSNVLLVGEHDIAILETYYGDVAAIDLMGDSILEFDLDNVMNIDKVKAASKLHKDLAAYNALVAANKTPYPNNFDLCTIRIQDESVVIGDIPKGLAITRCVNRFT